MNIKTDKPIRTKIFSFIISILLTLAGLSSCEIETESEAGDFTVPSRLVLNGVLYAHKDTSRIYFSESKSIFSKENARKVLQAKYDSSSWYADPTVYLLPDVKTTIYKNNQLQQNIYIDPEDSITYFIDQLKAGDQIRIEANRNGKKVSSSATIPADPVILNIDTLSFFNYQSTTSYYSNYGQMLRILVKIKDQPGVKNYYRIFADIDIEYHVDPEYAKENKIPEIIHQTYTGFYSDDPVITNGKPSTVNYSEIDIIRSEQNQYCIFTDELFEGKEYTLNIYISHPDEGGFTNYYSPYYYRTYSPYYFDFSEGITEQKTKLIIRLQTINEEMYQYYSSLQRFLYYNNNRIEPTKVFNNIDGGLGIWGAVNEKTQMVFEKDTIYSR